MSRLPQVSVVMGVHNAASGILGSLQSVLNVSDLDLECIVVDDGSRDETPRLLAELAARDARLCVVTTPRAGLTRALMRGCEAARAPFIARLDAGDRMLSSRLVRQHAELSQQPDTAVLSSAYRLCGPRGEHLHDVHAASRPVDLTSRMRTPRMPRLDGIAHPTVMMRSEHYRRAGGYRSHFALAQDVDLWARMASLGRVVRSGEVLTELRVGLDSLSPRHHRTQQRLRRLAERAAGARLRGEDEAPWLNAAARLSEQRVTVSARGNRWRAAYFVAACLDARGECAAARDYYREAVARSRLALRPRLRLAMLSVRER